VLSGHFLFFYLEVGILLLFAFATRLWHGELLLVVVACMWCLWMSVLSECPRGPGQMVLFLLVASGSRFVVGVRNEQKKKKKKENTRRGARCVHYRLSFLFFFLKPNFCLPL
jgi:hypothetical protein